MALSQQPWATLGCGFHERRGPASRPRPTTAPVRARPRGPLTLTIAVRRATAQLASAGQCCSARGSDGPTCRRRVRRALYAAPASASHGGCGGLARGESAGARSLDTDTRLRRASASPGSSNIRAAGTPDRLGLSRPRIRSIRRADTGRAWQAGGLGGQLRSVDLGVLLPSTGRGSRFTALVRAMESRRRRGRLLVGQAGRQSEFAGRRI